MAKPSPNRHRMVQALRGPVRWAIHTAARVTRPMTLGVRAVLIDPAGRVFLVRHSYVPGWHLPGGGVETGETVREALVREVREEAGLEIRGTPRLHGLFFNPGGSRRDHVAVFVVREFGGEARRDADWEIVEAGFFDPAALPDGTAAATRARVAEVVSGAAPADLW